MSNILGGLNYDATLSAEDYKAYRNLLEEEILTRFLLSTGSPPNTLPATGIADLIDPTSISASETTRPFLVTISSLNPLQIQVNPGLAVTSSGAVIQTSTVSYPILARILANDINVVYLENSIIQGGTKLLNDYQEDLNSQEIQSSTILGVALMTDWINASLFSPTRKNNIVVIAIVSVLPTANSSLELQIDMTRNTYAYNRPWFTIKDIQHRASVGAGTVTDTNPHGTALNDLSTAGNISLFQGLVDTGTVVSRDRTIAKLKGAKYCLELIPTSRIQTDVLGNITALSIYGGVGARYCQLLTFPTRVGSVYETLIPANAISYDWIEGTNLLIFGFNESLANALTVEYTETQALVPPVSASTTVLTFGTPITDEILISGGLTSTTIADPTLDLIGSGPFPRRYSVYYLATGSLAYYPQIILPATTMNSIGTALYSPPTPIVYPSRIRMGVTQALAVVGMSIQVTLYGKDVTGAALTETIMLSSAAGYADETIPSTNYDAPNQQVVSKNSFAILNNIQILRALNTDPTPQPLDGPLSKIQLWADCEPSTAPDLNDMLKVANISWNGQGIAAIEDARLISKGFFRPIPAVLEGGGGGIPGATGSIGPAGPVGPAGANNTLSNLNPTTINQNLNFSNALDRSVSIDPMTGQATGKNLTLKAGDAAGTDSNGGSVIISSGLATGDGSGSIILKAIAAGQGAGISSRVPQQIVEFQGDRIKFGIPLQEYELWPLQPAISLLDNTTDGIIFSYPVADATFYEVHYSIVRYVPPISTYAIAGTTSLGIDFDSFTNSIWLADPATNFVRKVDVTTGTVTSTYAVANGPHGVAFDPDTQSIWVTQSLSGQVAKMNVLTGALTSYLVGTNPHGIAFDPVTHSVWVANFGSNTVSKVNITTGTSTSYLVGAGFEPDSIAFDPVNNAIWVTNYTANSVTKIDILTGIPIATYPIVGIDPNPRPTGIVYDSSTQSVWVVNSNDPTVTKVDIHTGVAATYIIGGIPTNPLGITFDPTTNSIWVAPVTSAFEYRILRLNPLNGGILDTYIVSGAGAIIGQGLTFDSFTQSVWITQDTAITKVIVDPLHSASAREYGIFTIITDNTLASLAPSSPNQLGGSPGVTFSADVAIGHLRLKYTTTSTGLGGTMKYHMQRWLA